MRGLRNGGGEGLIAFSSWRDRLRSLKREALVVWIAARDPRTPWAVRLLAMAVAAYAFSPIDLIPDFIPVLGLLDDLVLIPLGVWLALRLAPEDLASEWRAQASDMAEKPVSKAGLLLVVALWATGTAAALALLRD